jgi:hypothetical protein
MACPKTDRIRVDKHSFSQQFTKMLPFSVTTASTSFKNMLTLDGIEGIFDFVDSPRLIYPAGHDKGSPAFHLEGSAVPFPTR